MYTILVCDNNDLYGSNKERIMQKEKLFNKIWFLVAPHYNGYNMADCTVTMRYLLPISKEFRVEKLSLSEEKYVPLSKEKEKYEGYLKYVLPIDTELSKEFGDIELNLTFMMLDYDDNGEIIQRVRKTNNHILHITKIPNWDSIIPDPALAELDQRILKQDGQIKALEILAEKFSSNQVDNLVYNGKDETLQLSARGIGVGNKVSVKDMLDDGIPVVDLNSNSDGSDNNHNNGCNCERCECEDNVVEFGDVVSPEAPDVDIDNTVEF